LRTDVINNAGFKYDRKNLAQKLFN